MGLLTGILLVGGPSLYRTAWQSPDPTEVVSAPVVIAAGQRPSEVEEGPVEPPVTTASRRQLDVVTIHGKPEKAKEVRPSRKPETPTPKVNPRRQGQDHLTDQERAELARFDGKGVALQPLRPGDHESNKPQRLPSLSQEDFWAVVTKNKPALTQCYESSLRGAGGQQDGPIRISVIVTVSPSGKVRSVEARGEGLPGLTDCLERVPKRWAFAASDGESAFDFPLVFQPGR